MKGVNLTLIGVNVNRGKPTSSRPASGGRPTDFTWLYIRAKDILELDVAKSIHDELEKKIGVATFLILRTDSFFVEYDGPAADIFAKSLPEGSAVGFLQKPHIVCAPNATGGRCLLVTSPPKLPAEGWRNTSPRSN
jgi:hypothetical protein